MNEWNMLKWIAILYAKEYIVKMWKLLPSSLSFKLQISLTKLMGQIGSSLSVASRVFVNYTIQLERYYYDRRLRLSLSSFIFICSWYFSLCLSILGFLLYSYWNTPLCIDSWLIGTREKCFSTLNFITK